MWLRHVQLYVVYPYAKPFMPPDGFYGRFVSLAACRAADAFLEGVLRRYDEVYKPETSLLGHVLHDREVADVQWIE